MKCMHHRKYREDCNSCSLARQVNKAYDYYETFPQWEKDYYARNKMVSG